MSSPLCSAKQKLTGGSWQPRGVKFKALVVPAQQMGTSLLEGTWSKHWPPRRDLWSIQWTILSQSIQDRVFQSSHTDRGLFQTSQQVCSQSLILVVSSKPEIMRFGNFSEGGLAIKIKTKSLIALFSMQMSDRSSHLTKYCRPTTSSYNKLCILVRICKIYFLWSGLSVLLQYYIDHLLEYSWCFLERAPSKPIG